MLHKIHTIIRTVVAPPFCLYCQQWLLADTVLCAACMALIRPMPPVYVALAHKRFMTVYALGAYQEPLRSLVLAKHSGNRAVSKQLGLLMRTLSVAPFLPCDVLIPIPLHWRRKAQRGYNQAEVLATQLARGGQTPVVPLLYKGHATAPQAGYALAQRISNIRGSFILSEIASAYKHKHLILVDDVMTSGVTLREAARALLPLEPASLTAVVACRVH